MRVCLLGLHRRNLVQRGLKPDAIYLPTIQIAHRLISELDLELLFVKKYKALLVDKFRLARLTDRSSHPLLWFGDAVLGGGRKAYTV